MRKSLLTVLAFYLLLLGESACKKYNYENDNPKAIPGPTDTCNTDVTYTNKVSKVLASKCLTCHSPSGGTTPDLSTYTLAKTSAIRIVERAVNLKTMPEAGSPQLSQCEMDMLKTWLNNSTPQ
jgi:uncharacterized membrane protein